MRITKIIIEMKFPWSNFGIQLENCFILCLGAEGSRTVVELSAGWFDYHSLDPSDVYERRRWRISAAENIRISLVWVSFLCRGEILLTPVMWPCFCSSQILDCLGLIDDPDSSEVAAYLKKILKSNGRRTTENHVNGSDSATPRRSSVPDLLVGVDVSSIEKNKR